jgi:hypothetical protein
MWKLPDETDIDKLCPAESETERAEFHKIFESRFHPGQLLNWLNLHDIKIENRFDWLKNILSKCKRRLVAGLHEGGYWIDHWTYLVDMLQAYEAIYPESVEKMLTEKADIEWFDEGAYVVPRKDKYFIKKFGPLQLNAVTDVKVSDDAPNLPPVTMFAKLCALVAVKAVSFDTPAEVWKWKQAVPAGTTHLNGLPGCSAHQRAKATTRKTACGFGQYKTNPGYRVSRRGRRFNRCDVKHCNSPNIPGTTLRKSEKNIRKQIRFNISDEKNVAGQTLEELLECVQQSRLGGARSVDSASGLIHTYYSNDPTEMHSGQTYRLLELKKGVPL